MPHNDRPPLAQPGDETKRQLGVNSFTSLTEGLNAQLQNAINVQHKGQARSELVQEFAPEVSKNVEAVRDLSQRVPGEAPSALLKSASSLGQAFVSSAAEIAQQASSDNVINLISQIAALKQQQEDAVRKSVEDGFKVNLDGTIEPLSDIEGVKRTLVGEEAVAEVIKQGGSDLIRKGGSKDERYAIAESILKSGGMQQYRNQIPFIELITEAEGKDIDKQTDLLQLIDQGISLFSKTTTFTGTGFLAQLIPGFLAGKETRSLRRSVENIKAQYAKIISGATVSDREMTRLEKFLPTSGKSEKENLEDLQQLSKDIQINQLIFERGKREGLTANEAYAKYGEEIFAQFSESTEVTGDTKIRVRRKSDGQLGTLDGEDEFDSTIYERLP